MNIEQELDQSFKATCQSSRVQVDMLCSRKVRRTALAEAKELLQEANNRLDRVIAFIDQQTNTGNSSPK